MKNYYVKGKDGTVVEINELTEEKSKLEEKYTEDFNSNMETLNLTRFGFTLCKLSQPCENSKDSEYIQTVTEYLKDVEISNPLTSTVGLTNAYDIMKVACSHTSALEQAKAYIYESVYKDWYDNKIRRDVLSESFIASNLKIEFKETLLNKLNKSEEYNSIFYEVCSIITFLGVREVKTYLVRTFEL